jgi:phosphinothricin acetyltransferase
MGGRGYVTGYGLSSSADLKAPEVSVIRDVTLDDAAAICSIYNPHVLGTTVTFEEEAVTVDVMRDRIAEVISAHPWIVWEASGEVVAYSYAAKWRLRSGYRYSVETTVYIAPDFQGQGLGIRLGTELLVRLRRLGLHRAMAGIALPNPGSVALHERLGYRKVAHLDEVGRKFDRWIDVGYWQIDLA